MLPECSKSMVVYLSSHPDLPMWMLTDAPLTGGGLLGIRLKEEYPLG